MLQLQVRRHNLPTTHTDIPTQHKIKREQYAILFTVADRRKKDRIDIHDWSVFNNLLAKADSEYYVAFQLFADEETGLVDFNSFKEKYARHRAHDNIPFNWDSSWAQLYLGAG
jgi:solute carrier family 25 aspartate/glutamate transporter 12/13